MALRVLLADESVTIKRVFQLALQDYGVEVLSVNVGLDVASVATKFNPDIIFADVLLQKKNGYEVSLELKNNPQLKSVPVVLIWSGFMDFDESKFKSSLANAHLEKPFDTEKLRQIVQNLVPKTKTQSLSGFLSFPKLPEFEEKSSNKSPSVPETKESLITPPPPEFTASTVMSDLSPHEESESPPQSEGEWTMENFEPLSIPEENYETDEHESEEFVSLELQHSPPPLPDPTSKSSDSWVSEGEDESSNLWVQKTLSKYKMDIKPEDEEPTVSYQIPQDKIDAESIVTNKVDVSSLQHEDGEAEEEEEIELDLSEEPMASTPNVPQLNEKQLEAIIRAQSKEVIEKVVWQVLPEIATQIIEREIDKLLKEKHELRSR